MGRHWKSFQCSSSLKPPLKENDLETLSITQARRLALARSGLLNPERTGLPRKARGTGAAARRAAQAVINRFGYLQLDTVSIAGARSHSIVLLSRLEGIGCRLGEELLRPGADLFEYWGHEACWIPLDLYPALEFRRREFEHHPWWGDLVGAHPEVADNLRRKIRAEGPLRTLEMEGRSGNGWWDLKLAKRVASALWSSGELAIRERNNFQRVYDLAERVIPSEVRDKPLSREDGIETLLLKALDGHGWATSSTLAATWRLSNGKHEVSAALKRMRGRDLVVACALELPTGRSIQGWIRPDDLEFATGLERLRPRRDKGVLLSPFDPLLWDRSRVATLFGFDMMLEIFKPADNRVYGYYCMPVLAGDRLVARFDFKAKRKQRQLEVLSCRWEGADPSRPASAADLSAAKTALQRYAEAVQLDPVGW